MRSHDIQLAYANTTNTCLAVEYEEECPYNPRSIQEDWSIERRHLLQRVRDAFEHDPQSFSRARRIILSKHIIYGQVCQYHHRHHAERLHTLHVIRGDAINDLLEPTPTRVSRGRVRTAAARRARKREVRSANCLALGHGREGDQELADTDEGTPSSAAVTQADDTSQAPHPITPRPAANQTSLEQLMLLGYLQESEDRVRQLEHDAYVASDEAACLRRQHAELAGRMFQLKLEKVQQDQELIQTQNLLRSASKQFLGFLAAKNR